jgi:ubiquinone biosynthesis protein UbiJ
MSNLSSTSHTIAASAFCRAVNHVLSSEPWASAQLAKHAGKTVLIELPFGRMCFEIDASGLLASLGDLDETSLALQVSPQALTSLLSGPGNLREQAFKAVKITGDADLAQLIGSLAGQLRWEYEEDLAKIVGDAPANFAVTQGKKLLSATRSASSDLLSNLVEYVSEERKVLLNKRDFMVHKSKANDLRDAVDRLEKRIQFIEQRVK